MIDFCLFLFGYNYVKEVFYDEIIFLKPVTNGCSTQKNNLFS